MTLIASLPMYDWPEEHSAVDAFYRGLREAVPELPSTLQRPETEEETHRIWRAPELALSQTCWGPLRRGLMPHVHVLAQPSYDDVEGGNGVYYRSAIVMREGARCDAPEAAAAALPEGLDRLRPAINDTQSLSGAMSLAEDMNEPGLADRAVVAGSHRNSIRAVAEGRADFAAIDCRSWALALAHEPAAQALTVTGWTACRMGLPFITARTTPPDLRARIAAALFATGAQPPDTPA